MSSTPAEVHKKWAGDQTTLKRLSLRAKQAAPGINKAQAAAIAKSFLQSEILGEIIHDAVKRGENAVAQP